jgi:hypothetical protein
MKTITIILATLLIVQVNSLLASNDGVPVKTNKEMSSGAVLLLSPSTPKEATFEEMAPAAEIFVLAPVTPKEASFEDETEDLSITNLAPVTPAEADFNDDEPAQNTDTISLAPVTPAEADFTELL